MKTVVVSVNGEPILSKCHMATNIFEKTRGLLGRDESFALDGLFFPDSRSVQMMGMKYDITAVSIGKDGVIRKVKYLKKGWHSFTDTGAKHVLECHVTSFQTWSALIGKRVSINHESVQEQ